MARGEKPPSSSVTFASGRLEGQPSEPDLRILHLNDVYHVDPSSSEPVGGLPRFITLCREYSDGERYAGQSKLLTLFSGDSFNPSLESSVTKGVFRCWLHDFRTWYTDGTRQTHGLCSESGWHRRGLSWCKIDLIVYPRMTFTDHA